MIYNDAWRGVCALYDAVYGTYREEDGDAESESEEEEAEGEE